MNDDAWKYIDLHGAVAIERLVNVYGIWNEKTTNIQVKVMQRKTDFYAKVNVRARGCEWIVEAGASEQEVLILAIKATRDMLPKLETYDYTANEVEWYDPVHF